MTTVGILQARMTSSRLPGKVLAPVLDAPMIGRQVERLRRAQLLEGIIVATSTDASDDELADYADGLGLAVVRGSLDDVLGRFVQAIHEHGIDVVVRLTADCPLASPSVIDRVVRSFHDTGFDYVSNTLQPTYPDGLDVEVVRSDVLEWVAQHTSDQHEREHVTLGVYRRPERFSALNVAGQTDLSELRWTVDNADDLTFVREVYGRLYAGNPEFDVEEILELLQAEPSLSRTTSDAARNAALEGLETGVMNA